MSKKYGLIYMGSKNTIAPQIVEYILARHSNKTIFIDACCGGLAIADYILQKHPDIDVYCNDYDDTLISLYKDLQDKSKRKELLDNYAYRFITKKEFDEIKKNGTSSQKGLMTLLWSFGTQGAAYLYGADIELQKHQLSDLLIFGKSTLHNEQIDNWYKNDCPQYIKDMNYKTTPRKRILFLNSWKEYINDRCELQQLQQLERLQQLQQLERLEQLQRLHCGDAIEWIKSLPKEVLNKAIIYFDPPYINTNKYKITDYSFNERIRQFALANKDIPIYISEYTQYQGLEVARYELKRQLVQGGNGKQKKELLLYNGCKDCNETLEDLLWNKE